jgi:CspA family cold shock protein
MEVGKIKKLSDRGFGFIVAADGDRKEIFFHRSECQVAFDSLSEGQEVTFDLSQDVKGPRAKNVRLK